MAETRRLLLEARAVPSGGVGRRLCARGCPSARIPTTSAQSPARIPASGRHLSGPFALPRRRGRAASGAVQGLEIRRERRFSPSSMIIVRKLLGSPRAAADCAHVVARRPEFQPPAHNSPPLCPAGGAEHALRARRGRTCSARPAGQSKGPEKDPRKTRERPRKDPERLQLAAATRAAQRPWPDRVPLRSTARRPGG
jgi:hypothetical protein